MRTAAQDDVIKRLIQWCEQRESVRALVLTSSRANPNAAADRFSDYDVILVLQDMRPLINDKEWLEDFGRTLVVYRDPLRFHGNFFQVRYITQYEDGTKIDFTLWPVGRLRSIIEEKTLPDELDVGYTVLLDKEKHTSGLKAPTYRAHIPKPPTEAEYENAVEEFFHEATYVAKHLWRVDLMPAKYNLDHAMKQVNLRRMLEWHIEIKHQWSIKPGDYGKGLQDRLGPEIWSELEDTYVGPDIEQNWQALFRTISLFRTVAEGVARELGFSYPQKLDERVRAYLHQVKDDST